MLDDEIMLDDDLPELEDFDTEADVVIIPDPIIPTKKVNYLNNKDLLKEIHYSKNSFSEYVDAKYSDYDVIVDKLEDVFLPETIIAGKAGRAARLAAAAYAAAVLANPTTKIKLSEFKIDPETIDPTDITYRVLTFEHIPLAPGRKKTPRSVADNYVKLNFYPFKHYTVAGGVATEVGRSHTKGGVFSLDHGSITVKLSKMLMLMVNKYGQRSNWRNYTYVEEMKGQSLLQLSQMALQFDESRSDNPFSYYTQSLQNSFTKVLNLEKRNQDLRDDLLIGSGASPSFSRQLAEETKVRERREMLSANSATPPV